MQMRTRSEKPYDRALVAAPANTRSILLYAWYRADIGDIDGAIALFKTAMLVEPDLVWYVCRFSNSLLEARRTSEGLDVLNWVASLPDLTSDLKLQIAFLRVAHDPDGKKSAVHELCQLVESGVSCERWSPDATVRWAEETSHPDLSTIHSAANVATGRTPPATLG